MKAHIYSTQHPGYTLCEVPRNKLLATGDCCEVCNNCMRNAALCIVISDKQKKVYLEQFPIERPWRYYH